MLKKSFFVLVIVATLLSACMQVDSEVRELHEIVERLHPASDAFLVLEGVDAPLLVRNAEGVPLAHYACEEGYMHMPVTKEFLAVVGATELVLHKDRKKWEKAQAAFHDAKSNCM